MASRQRTMPRSPCCSSEKEVISGLKTRTMPNSPRNAPENTFLSSGVFRKIAPFTIFIKRMVEKMTAARPLVISSSAR